MPGFSEVVLPTENGPLAQAPPAKSADADDECLGWDLGIEQSASRRHGNEKAVVKQAELGGGSGSRRRACYKMQAREDLGGVSEQEFRCEQDKQLQ